MMMILIAYIGHISYVVYILIEFLLSLKLSLNHFHIKEENIIYTYPSKSVGAKGDQFSVCDEPNVHKIQKLFLNLISVIGLQSIFFNPFQECPILKNKLMSEWFRCFSTILSLIQTLSSGFAPPRLVKSYDSSDDCLVTSGFWSNRYFFILA